MVCKTPLTQAAHGRNPPGFSRAGDPLRVLGQHRVRMRAMQAFTLRHFAVAHPADAFPSFTTIASEETERLREHRCHSARSRTPTWRRDRKLRFDAGRKAPACSSVMSVA